MEWSGARRILVGLRYGIGDVVMELPVLAALRAAAPRARIVALGAAPATELLDAGTLADGVESFQRWGVTHRWDAGTGEGRAAFDGWVGSERFDLLLDVHQLPGAVASILRKRSVPVRDSDPEAEAGEVRRGGGAVAAISAGARRGWGLPVGPVPAPVLPLRPEDRAFAAGFLAEHGIGGSPVAVSTSASLGLKRWPLDRVARVADRLVERTGERILVLAGPGGGEVDALRALVRRPGRLVAAAGLHLLRVAALLDRCRAVLCNDTGVMHLAAAVGTPTVAVFGPTAPSTYAPRAPQVRALGGADPCPHRRTGSLAPPGCWGGDRCLVADRGCIERVSEAEVLDALGSVLTGLPA